MTSSYRVTPSSRPTSGTASRSRVLEQFSAAEHDHFNAIDFWLLQDMVTDDYSAVRFFTPFDEFKPPAIPQDLHTYREYRRRSIEFVEARNRRMTDSGSARDSGPTLHP